MNDAAAQSNPRAERRLQILDELAELGLAAARLIVAKAEDETAGDTALALDRVARAVRLTLMLQGRLEAEAGRGAPDAHEQTERRKARVQRIVERVAEADPAIDTDKVETLVCDAVDRLDDEDLYGDLMDRPVREIVERICKDLGLTPDWTVLGQELWAKEEAESPNPTRPPPLAGEGDPQGGGGIQLRYGMPPQSLRDSSPASGGARGSLSEQFPCEPRRSPSNVPDD